MFQPQLQKTHETQYTAFRVIVKLDFNRIETVFRLPLNPKSAKTAMPSVSLLFCVVIFKAGNAVIP